MSRVYTVAELAKLQAVATRNFKDARERLRKAAVDFLDDVRAGPISNVMHLHHSAEHDCESRMKIIARAQEGREGYMERVAAFPHDWAEKVLKGEL